MRLFAKVLQLRMQWLFSKATDAAAAISMGSDVYGPQKYLMITE